MYRVLAPELRSHFRSSLAMNSGPLSERICSGMPCSIMASASTSITFWLFSLRRTQPHTRSVMEPQPASWLLLLGNLQPFTAPDAFDSVLAYPPAGSLQQRRDAAIAVAAIFTGQLDNGPGQCIFVLTLCRLVALRAAWLIHQLARSPLTHATLSTRMAHRTTPPFRA